MFVRLEGDLNKDNIDKFNTELTRLVKDNGIRNIVFNLKRLKTIDKEGLKAILYNYELCKMNDGRSLLCGNNDNIRNKLKSSKLINYIYETKDEITASRILNLR